MIEIDIELPQAQGELRVSTKLSGPCVALLGASGAGKTSLLESIVGLRRARGRISVLGRVLQDARHSLPPEQRRVGYVPQDTRLFPHLSVRDNLRYARRSVREPEVVSALELAPLLEQFPSTLSGGQKQRVALARALLQEPALLLLDEPLASLDLASRGRLLPYLSRVHAELGVPFIYVTHQLQEAELITQEALWLADGQVRDVGPTAQVTRKLLAGGALELQSDNLLVGDVVHADDRTAVLVLTSGGRLQVPWQPARRGAVFQVRADDVLLARGPMVAVSARNVFVGEVRDVMVGARGAWVRVLGLGVLWTAHVTADALAELALEVGGEVTVLFKAQAVVGT